MEERREGYLLSDDPARLDLGRVYGWLRGAYWSEGVRRDVVERAFAHSIGLGVYALGAGAGGQVGVARVVTDRATFAWVCDVYVDDAHRGRGLARWMVGAARTHPELRGLRRWLLATRDAHGVYDALGFGPLSAPERWMERVDRTSWKEGGTTPSGA